MWDISVAGQISGENISWISAQLLQWKRGRPSWVPSPSWGALTLHCLNWETSRLVQAIRIQLITMSPVGHLAERIGWKWPQSHPLRSAYGLWEDYAYVAAGSPFASRCWNSNLETPCYSKTFFKNVFQEERFNRSTYILSIYFIRIYLIIFLWSANVKPSGRPGWENDLQKQKRGYTFYFLTLVPLTSCWRLKTLRQYASLSSFISSKSIQMSQSRNC